MKPNLPFFNFSLKKLLASESSTFQKSKIKILFTVLIFSLIKALVVIYVAWYNHQSFQLARALILLFFYIIFLKFLLAKRTYITPIAHVMIFIGLLTTWSIVYISAQSVNIAMLQFVFMLILSSFYLLGTRIGIFYAFFSVLPIIMNLFSGHNIIDIDVKKDVLASPGYEILVIINFISIITAHYLFHRAFMENLKEKESLNLQLQIAVEEANEAAKSKTNFLSTMSHELRTPLNSVLGMTDMFLDEPNSSDREENLKVLKFSALSLHSLINDILDFNKLGSNKVILEEVSVNIYQLITDVCAALKFQAKEKEIELIVNIDETIKDQYFITDPIRITQIIYNLVGNALKFTSKGSVKVCLNVLDRKIGDIKIKFSIIDTGIGISSDKQELIFEAFHQASSSTSRNYGGTGLGLSIVKQLLELFNSKIYLKSTPDFGSDFFFELLLKLDNEPIIGEQDASETIYDLSHLRVLVAEDNLMNRLLMKKIFSKWNNELVFVENGKEAIEIASKEVFDVILMDLYMPLVDGYTAAREIRKLADFHKDVHIIAFTASVSNTLYEDIKAAGMNDCVSKPFNTKELYQKLKNLKTHIL